VLGIVPGHRGAIKVYSEEKRGTTFQLLFPAARIGTGAATQSGEGIPAWQGSGTVLLVDDEETIALLGSRMLER